MVLHWNPSNSKSPQVSRILLSIRADLNNAVDGIVLIRPLISNYSSPLFKPLRTVPSISITIGITFPSHVSQLSQFSDKVQLLVTLFIFFDFLCDLPGCEFFASILTGGFFYLRLNNSKSSILAVVWMIEILPLISCSPSFFSRSLETVLRTPTTIRNHVMFHNFFSYLTRSKFFLPFRFLFFSLYCPMER